MQLSNNAAPQECLRAVKLHVLRATAATKHNHTANYGQQVLFGRPRKKYTETLQWQ